MHKVYILNSLTEKLNEELREDLAAMSTKANIPVPRLVVYREAEVNKNISLISLSQRHPAKPDGTPAGGTPEIVISIDRECLEHLTHDEILATAGHEVAHMLQPPYHGWRINPKREYDADRVGAELTGKAKAMATSLIKLEALTDKRTQEILTKTLADDGLPAESWRHKMILKQEPKMSRAIQRLAVGVHPETAYRVGRLLKQDAHMYPTDTPHVDFLKIAFRMQKEIRQGMGL